MSTQKTTEKRYSIIPRTLSFLRRENSVLLLKGAPDKRLWANLYNGVGGHIEQGEDIFSAAKREILEETGLVPESLYLCGTIIIDTGDYPGIGIFVFTGESRLGRVKPSPEGVLEWVEPTTVFNLDLVNDLYELLPYVLTWKPTQKPFSALYKSIKGTDGLSISFSAI